MTQTKNNVSTEVVVLSLSCFIISCCLFSLRLAWEIVSSIYEVKLLNICCHLPTWDRLVVWHVQFFYFNKQLAIRLI